MTEERTYVEALQALTERLLKEAAKERRFRYMRLVAMFSMALITSVAFLSVLSVLGSFSKSSFSDSGINKELYKSFSWSSPSKNEAKIAIIALQGTIFPVPSGNNVMNEDMVRKIVEKLHYDPSVHTVILEIKSPGGELVETDNIFRLLTQRLAGTKKITYINGMAASGGYYIALAGDEIVAHPLSLVGNVGVIMQTFNVKGLADKIGVRVNTYKSGELKDIGNPFRDPTDREQNILKGSIMEMQQVFLRRLTERRGEKLNKKELWQVKEGQIFSSSQAKRLGLIDRELYFDELIDELVKGVDKNAFSKISVVRYSVSPGFLNGLFGSFFQKALGELASHPLWLVCC